MVYSGENDKGHKLPDISFLVAMDQNGLIGKDNRLPWSLPADMAFFKRTTMGKVVVMGRKTHESIGGPLKGRINVVMTRNPGYRACGDPPDVMVAHSLDEVLTRFSGHPIIVIGGEEIFRLFMPYVRRMYITMIEGSFEGDTYFPEIDPDDWQLVSAVPGITDEKNPYPHRFLLYERLVPWDEG